MGDFLLKLRLLGDTLDKKKELLHQILSITENQETILMCGDQTELGDMFGEMNEEKQKLINELLQADVFFQNLFSEISPDFNENAQRHKPDVEHLQDMIRDVTDLDVKIRVQERKNRDIIQRVGPKTKIPVPKAPKEYVIKQYELNSKKPKKPKGK